MNGKTHLTPWWPATLAIIVAGTAAEAQEIEPRAYSNAPIGMNFAVVGYAATRGALAFDTALAITDPKLQTSTIVVAYAHVFELWGQSAKIDAIAPYTWLSGTARVDGEPASRVVDGPGNPSVRVSVNLLGAPALGLKDFARYRQDLIIGASLQIIPPLAQYDDTRLVNIGGNRWSFKPEVGVSKAVGSWTLEGQASAIFFTDNDDFLGDGTRSQQPVYAFQGHLIRTFRNRVWVSADLTYFTGGASRINGLAKRDLQKNLRLGGTLSLPVGDRNSVKLYASSGVSARTGNNFDLVGVAWQHRWGGRP